MIAPRDSERERDPEDTLLGCLLVPLVLPLAMLRAFVVAKLWLWFVVPFGLVAIPTGRVMGLFAIVSIVQSQFTKLGDWTKHTPSKDLLRAEIILAVYWLVALLVGRVGLWMAP